MIAYLGLASAVVNPALIFAPLLVDGAVNAGLFNRRSDK
jgi:hypothetical protein